VLRERIADTGLPVAYCNLVGGQDELVFDGGSFALDQDGTLAWQGACLPRSCAAALCRRRLAGPRRARRRARGGRRV
jgi:predicted amidohydrolase